MAAGMSAMHWWGPWVLLVLSSWAISNQADAQQAAESAKTPASSSTRSANMSSLLGQQTLMTNASLVLPMSSKLEQTNKTVNLHYSSKTSSTFQPINSSKSASAVHQQGPTNLSPAANLSRLKQVSRLSNTSQMAAESSHDSQSFVTINSASSVSVGPMDKSPTAAAQISPKVPSKQAQARPRPPVSAAPKYLPSEQQVIADQQQQQQFQPVEADVGAQLERPSGYSYEPASSYAPAGAYLHTSPLSPARHELQQARQKSRAGNYERLAHAMQSDQARPGEPVKQFASAGHAQFAVDAAGLPVRPPPPPLGYTTSPALAEAPMPSNPCRPTGGLLHDLGQTSVQAPLNELAGIGQIPTKYRRASEGTRLRSQFVFKVIRADSLTDCELACTRASSLAGNNLADSCRSFNYRAHFAAENCELSRHELRSLKLDDSAQFEQHTQFDFYALVDMPTSAMLSSATSGSLTYAPFVDPDCLDVSQSCSQDGMEFSLRTSEPFRGRIYTYGFYDSCFYDGEGSTLSVLRISRANGFPRCGTQHFGDMMTNIVVVQFNDHVQTTRDKRYNLTCFFSGPGEAVVTSNYLDAKIDERSHPIQVEHLPPQNVITSNVHLRVLYRNQPTNAIAVGDLLTFRLETARAAQTHRASDQLTAGPASEIFATNVIAKDPYSGRQVQLIDGRGCPLDPVNVFPELQRTPDGALESEFYAFKIPDSNFLIFQATVRTCRAPCEPVICQPAASALSAGSASHLSGAGGTKSSAYLVNPHLASSAPSWGRRRRRRSTLGDGEEPEDVERELLAAGESVVHVIPARLANSSSEPGLQQPLAQVRTFVKPDLSEAEEEVKEMFRVYLSRAEMNRLARERQRDLHQVQRPTNETSLAASLMLAEESSAATKTESGQEVCVSPAGFYVMLFSVVSLSLATLTILIVLLYVTRQAKLDLSDSIANSIY